MITDYQNELTASAGHGIDFNASSEYGSKPFDLKLAAIGADDPAVGEPLHVMMQVVTADITTLTSVTIALVNDTDGAGGSEVSLVSKLFAQNILTQALGVRHVGIVPPGAIGATSKRYLSAKLTVDGTAGGGGAIKVWLQKGSYVTPANDANTL